VLNIFFLLARDCKMCNVGSGILLSEVRVARSSDITQTFNLTMGIKAT